MRISRPYEDLIMTFFVDFQKSIGSEVWNKDSQRFAEIRRDSWRFAIKIKRVEHWSAALLRLIYVSYRGRLRGEVFRRTMGLKKFIEFLRI